MSRLKYSLPICATLLFLSSTSWSQGVNSAKGKHKKLLDLANELKKYNAAARQHAQNQARQKNWIIRKKMPNGKVIELQHLSETGMPLYYQTENINAADTVSTDELWSGGSAGLNLDGSGMTVGEWDGDGVLTTHQELTGRVTQVDSPSFIDNHATHIAGTLIASGVDPNAKGMSPAANLEVYDWNSDSDEMAAAAAAGLLLSNHSYGHVSGWIGNLPLGQCTASWTWTGNNTDLEDYKFGFYNSDAKNWDTISYYAPDYLIVKSAGNNRNDTGPGVGVDYCTEDGSTLNTTTNPRNDDCGPDGYDCIPTAGTAKNILTVGAVGDLPGGYPASGAASAVDMTSFSGWGPTDDGRIKPDIVANGLSLYSSTDTGDNTYASMSGTSMAAPNATGSLLLLQQHYQNLNNGSSMRSATLKALAIHTADEAGPTDGPDYMFGWGLLNIKNAAEVISENGKTALIQEATYSPNTPYTLTVKATGGTPLVVTAAWTDPPGTTPSTSVDPTDVMLVNDLDMTVSDGATTWYPYILDGKNPSAAATTGDNNVDNIEKIVMNPPFVRTYTITVVHEGDISGGTQGFSLIITGIEATENKAMPWLMLLLKD